MSNNTIVTLYRVALFYVALFLCRVLFYLFNADTLGGLAWEELGGILRGSFVFDTVSVVYSAAVFVVAALIPFRFRERKGYQKFLLWLFTIINAINIFLNFADAIYFHYAKKRLTADEFYFTGNDNTGTIIWKALGENWWMIPLFVAFVWGIVWTYKRIKLKKSRIASNWFFYTGSTVVLVCVAVLMLGGARGGFKRTTRPITLSNVTQYVSTQKASLVLSNPFCILRTIGNRKIEYVRFFDDATLDRLFSPTHTPSGAGDGDKRNVVIFVLESFSREHSAYLNPDLYKDGVSYIPFIDSLMSRSYLFTNAYSSGRKSIDVLPSVLASIPSYKNPFILMPQSLGAIHAMPAILADEGYDTSFFCGSPRNSMGFVAFANRVGITRAFAQEEYEACHGKGDFDGYWGIWDKPFLEYMAETLTEIPEPFFSTVFTLSSHHPFVVPKEYESSLPKGETKMHRPIGYTDLAVRSFFEKAEKEPWFKNTVFVFTADHVSSEIFSEKSRTPTGNTSIIMFIHTPDGSLVGEDAETVQQLDIMPTILGILGYDRPYFAFGRDIFNEPQRPRWATNYINESYQVITDTLAYYFDGMRVTEAFDHRADAGRKSNLLDLSDAGQQRVDSLIRAYFQQYYRHIEERNFLPE